MTDSTTQATTVRDIVRSLRPKQWTKNAVVLAAFFFAFWDRRQDLPLFSSLLRVIPAAALFCALSSGIYVMNDIKDLEDDRKHPVKRHRPIAAGKISIPAAWTLVIVLLVCSAIGARALSERFTVVIGAYVAVQMIYSFGLKRIALLDVLVIAGGFVLRAIAGAVVLDVYISAWLLLCTFLLALFLALCKRRHEKILFSDGAAESRASLEEYDERLLDQLIAVVASATIVCYAIYTLSPGTVAKFGTESLGFTIPFVVFGIFRYMDLAYRHRKGGRPEQILLTDPPLLVDLVLYGLCTVVIFLLRS
ncbi:decaprenyl-phosphate phosphoribosyltransferase [Verrucomicrobiota bacterium]